MSDEPNQNNNSIAEEISEKSESAEKISPENPEEKKAKNRVIPEPVNAFEEAGDKTRVSTVSRILDKSIRGESCLVHIYGGNHIGKKFLLDAKEITIGREFGNQIVVDLDNVSRFHAKIYSDLTGVFIKDLDSTNGTFVNDVEISVEKLRNGDLIKIGGGIFKFISGGNVESLYYEEIYKMTIVDGLTQIHNKRYFLDFLDREMARCARYNSKLSLLMFDIDHFKKINDTYGHLAGDHILKEMSNKIAKRIRKEELFARYGGEEFVIILPETEIQQSAIFAEKLRQMVQSMSFVFEGGLLAITISIGIAEMADIRDPYRFIRKADRRLYYAKNNGRNRVITEIPDEEDSEE